MSFLRDLFGKLRGKGKPGTRGQARIKEPKYLQNASSTKAARELRMLEQRLGRLGPFQMIHHVAEIVKCGEGAVGPLCQTLRTHPKWEMRALAAKGLRDIGSKTGIPALILTLSHNDPQVRQPVVGALGAIGDPRAKPHLVAMLEDENESVRREVQRALKEIRS